MTQVQAAAVLGVSQSYLSLLEKRARPVTEALLNRMRSCAAGGDKPAGPDDVFRAQLSALGYPGFAHVLKSRSKPCPGAVLLSILSVPDADSRVVEALPWLVREHMGLLDFAFLVQQAKLQNLQNRLGFLLASAPVTSAEGLAAVRALERARLLREDTLCWDSMPNATREWMRSRRTDLARSWNILTRLRSEDLADAV